MKTKKLVGMAMLVALVAIFQIIATFIPMATKMTLTLVPIVVGAAIYGKACGALLGGVFGLTVLLVDPSVSAFAGINFFATIIMVLLKGIAAGWISGLVYELASKKSIYLGGVLAAIVCPVVNTSIFCLGMYFVFRDMLIGMAGGANPVYFLIFTVVGINFIIELGINIVLSPAIVRIIKAQITRKMV